MAAGTDGSTVERTHASLVARAEDLLRLLAAAVSAVRLYPPTSPIRAEAIGRFAREANAVSGTFGPVQYYVDRSRFIISGAAIGEGYPQVSALAEVLHGLQVGQLIIAPGLIDTEIMAFLDILSGDAAAVRESGGARSALLDAGVNNIALIEVSLRASSEEGLLGLDLTAAPLEEVAVEMQAAVQRWADAAGSDVRDMVAESIGRLEPAARDLAMKRCAEALLLLDEASRLRMLSSAVRQEKSDAGMDGMLSVVAHMPPAALARLLQLVATSTDSTTADVLGSIELPPEVAEQIAALLKPSPQSDAERGVPPEADVSGIAEEIAGADERDLAHIDVLVKATNGSAAAARGLATTLRLARDSRDEDSIGAVVDAIGPAFRGGAFAELASAASFLGQIAEDPRLATVSRAAQEALHLPALLEECARRLADDPEAAAPRTLLIEGGSAGAEAIVTIYLSANELQRANLLPTVGTMLEGVAPVAGRVLRSGDAASAGAVLRLLGSAGSRRLAPTIASGLEHLDSRVREAAVVALADSPGPESAQLLQKALGHWDPETRRAAAREIGRTGNEELVPALLKIIGEVSLLERNYELKKEVLKSLETLHSPRAVPVLRRLANRSAVIGKRNRELRYLARRVLESLEK